LVWAIIFDDGAGYRLVAALAASVCSFSIGSVRRCFDSKQHPIHRQSSARKQQGAVKGISHDQTHSSSPGCLSMNGHGEPRESQVAKLVAHGMTNKEIAEMMGGIAEQSVKNFVAHIMMKTGAPNRVRLVIWALKNDLINLENL
jgi:DNA-binding NarL/FixJ family response regulator